MQQIQNCKQSNMTMNKNYTIIIGSIQEYPFNLKDNLLPNFTYDVQIKYSLKDKSYQQYNKKIKKILDLQLLFSSLLKLNRIIQDKTIRQFIVVYEFLPYSLEDIHELKIEINKISAKIFSICQFLIHKRIKPVYHSKYFGFNQNKQLKYFLLPDFHQITNQNQLHQQYHQLQNKINNLLKQIKVNGQISSRQTIQDDKNSQRISERDSLRISQRDLKTYNKKFQQKISLIQSKLQLNRNGTIDKLSTSQKLKRRKKFSQNYTQENISMSSSSSNSIRINDKSKGFQDKKQNSIKNSYQQKNSNQEKQKYYIKSSKPLRNKSSSQQQNQSPQNIQQTKESKLTNSLIIQQKNQQMRRIKHHKSSFGDYSNYGNQSQKQQKLKRRISFALQKSQHALQVYEKYHQSMRHTLNHIRRN